MEKNSHFSIDDTEVTSHVHEKTEKSNLHNDFKASFHLICGLYNQ